MPGVNKVVLLGYLGRDPELKYTAAGDAVASASLATTEKWKGGEHTEWHTLTLWKRAAETFCDICCKGSLVYVEGSVRTSEWTDKQGEKRKWQKVKVHTWHIISGGRERDTGTDAAMGAPSGYEPIDDDDIPF